MSEDSVSDTYRAWDNKDYPSPPPEGWYQAPDGLWWPTGYGPGAVAPAEPAPVAAPPVEPVPVAAPPAEPAPEDLGPQSMAEEAIAETPSLRPMPSSETFSPPVAGAPRVSDLPPGSPGDDQGSEPMPAQAVSMAAPAPMAVPAQVAIPAQVEPLGVGPAADPGSGPQGFGSPADSAPGYLPPGSVGMDEDPEKSGSGKKVLFIILGLGLLVLAAAVLAGILITSGSDDDESSATTETTVPGDGANTTLETAPPTTASSLSETPAPGSGPGSFGEPWRVNDPVAIFYEDIARGGQQARWTIQATGPAVDGTQSVVEQSQSNQQPSADSIFVLIPIKITYKSGPSPVKLSDLQFRAAGNSGLVVNDLDNNCGVVPSQIDLAEDLVPGDVVEGNLCWSLPKDDFGALKLIIEVVAADGAVYIDVK